MELYPLEQLPSEPPTCSLLITDGGNTEIRVLWVFSLNALTFESVVGTNRLGSEAIDLK